MNYRWWAANGLMDPMSFQRMTPQQRMAYFAPNMLSGLGASDTGKTTLVSSGTRQLLNTRGSYLEMMPQALSPAMPGSPPTTVTVKPVNQSFAPSVAETAQLPAPDVRTASGRGTVAVRNVEDVSYPTGTKVNQEDVSMYGDENQHDTTVMGKSGGGGGAAATPESAAAMAATATSGIPTWVWVVGGVGLGFLAMKALKK